MNDSLRETGDPTPADLAAQQDLEIDLSLMSSVAIARLLEEVKDERPAVITQYNRTYNRHNR